MPDEAKAYHHGCGSASDCNLAEVEQGYREQGAELLKRAATAAGTQSGLKRKMDIQRFEAETTRDIAKYRERGE